VASVSTQQIQPLFQWSSGMFLFIHNSLLRASGLYGHLQASVFSTLESIQICSAIFL